MKCRRLKELKSPFAQDYQVMIFLGEAFFPCCSHTKFNGHKVVDNIKNPLFMYEKDVKEVFSSLDMWHLV